jgi:transcription elongation factor Elf1
MKIFEKLFCKHIWEVHVKRNFVRESLFPYLKHTGTIEILICKSCGKIKKIEY